MTFDEIQGIPLKEKLLDAETDFGISAKSKVKIISNSKGCNIEISVISGETELIDGLREEAIKQYKLLKKELEIINKPEEVKDAM